ncbi:MAG: hypothetical protein CMF50_00140 [Legionellales bacterium]|nr:hypothetical protein [Legionellales bacterium]|tara:strand:- start:1590 stop:3410 length:1821 start_codon:yes stop_codon:yes gene_type:complete
MRTIDFNDNDSKSYREYLLRNSSDYELKIKNMRLSSHRELVTAGITNLSSSVHALLFENSNFTVDDNGKLWWILFEIKYTQVYRLGLVNSVQDKTVEQIADGLRSLGETKVTSLSFKKNGIGKKSITLVDNVDNKLITSILKNTSVDTLSFIDEDLDKLSSESTLALFRGLEEGPVKYLYLHDNNLRWDNILPLIHALKSTNVVVLGLARNNKIYTSMLELEEDKRISMLKEIAQCFNGTNIEGIGLNDNGFHQASLNEILAFINGFKGSKVTNITFSLEDFIGRPLRDLMVIGEAFEAAGITAEVSSVKANKMIYSSNGSFIEKVTTMSRDQALELASEYKKTDDIARHLETQVKIAAQHAGRISSVDTRLSGRLDDVDKLTASHTTSLATLDGRLNNEIIQGAATLGRVIEADKERAALTQRVETLESGPAPHPAPAPAPIVPEEEIRRITGEALTKEMESTNNVIAALIAHRLQQDGVYAGLDSRLQTLEAHQTQLDRSATTSDDSYGKDDETLATIRAENVALQATVAELQDSLRQQSTAMAELREMVTGLVGRLDQAETRAADAERQAAQASERYNTEFPALASSKKSHPAASFVSKSYRR